MGDIMKNANWMLRAVIVPAVVLGLCGTASAATLGTSSGTGTFGASIMSLSGSFDFDAPLDPIFGDVGQYQFNLNTTQFNARDGNGASPGNGGTNPTHLKPLASWEILNTWGANSTFYGPSWNVVLGAGNTFTGTLATEGFIHWFYGYDEDVGGKTALAAFGQSSELSFVGSYQLQGNDLTYSMTVSTAPIPEPETYAMMLAGLGVLGVAARRRKQKSVV
jgi:hypothetical protein